MRCHLLVYFYFGLEVALHLLVVPGPGSCRFASVLGLVDLEG